MVAELFASAMQASFERDDANPDGFGHFVLAVSLLGECEQRSVFGFKLGEGVTERVQFFAVHRTRRLRDFGVFLLFQRRE